MGFRNELEAAFPKLVGCGGFELLRSNILDKIELELIPPPATGYTAWSLENESMLRQAMCYIRPIQRNLDLTPVASVVVNTLYIVSNVLISVNQYPCNS